MLTIINSNASGLSLWRLNNNFFFACTRRSLYASLTKILIKAIQGELRSKIPKKIRIWLVKTEIHRENSEENQNMVG